MRMYEYSSHGEVGSDQPWQRGRAGSLVSISGAGVLRYGDRLEKLFARTQSLIVVKMLLSAAAERDMPLVI